MEKGKENACLGRKADQVFVLILVDEISVSHMKSPGDEFQSLKRTYKLGNDGLYIMPGRYASDMIKNFEDFYGQAKQQKILSGPEN